ncbi:LuxR family transcriptional regulator [Burkholderia sp. MSMB0856]|uniref:response regulator transcription factor n=1 Tax=Burkholderia sp. MSMB0856 TaxID=1637869 RepID=UPI00075E13DA|nr:response regulator transcription factor [Burkholderia sp. MSMB0856]AOJ91212.1 LuxR family transcriptional regulator [Burkholderia sp. MSMB0856]KVH27977.1 LuxR family transcriptional regulator [Burkholderia sp. MSMB0856]
MSTPPHNTHLRIALLDSHELVRYALRTRIEQEPAWTVAAVFRQAAQLLDALADGACFDLVLMNHVLDTNDGLDLVCTLRANFPTTRILVCSEYERADTIARLFELGVNGFIGRTQSLDDHAEAVRKVAAGNTYFSARIMRPKPTTDTFAHPPPGPDGAPALISRPDLTARERTVLEYYLRGLSITQIADRVGRSYKTISSQKQSAYRKLGVSNDAELIAMLSHNGRASRDRY